jgi:hypothetical protein
MMKKLLSKNINIWQLIGYAVASLIGLSIIMLAMMFYLDVRTVVSDDAEDELERDYLTLTKPVGMVNISSNRTCFTQDEIDDLAAQPWVKRVGKFMASDFEVSASVQFGQRSMSTALFFESVPDEFIDIDTHGWSFDPAHPIINIILPKDYLALYNFGFASSQGLPQVGEGLLSSIPMQITISGNGKTGTYSARIIGFSTRINTVAVPAELIKWAHGIYGKPTEQKMPSRLIVEVSAKGDPAIKDYLESNNYETAKDNANDGKIAYILSVITAVVIAIGAIITALAFFILTLSLYLLLEKNHEMLHKLMLLGYSPSRVGSYYYIMVAIINAAVCLGAIGILLAISPVWETQLEAIGMTSVSPVSIILSGVIFTCVMTAVNILIIRTRVRSYFS